MANPAKKLSEVQENVWTEASGQIFTGLVIFLAFAALLYASKFLFHQSTPLLVARIIMTLGLLFGLAVIGHAVHAGVEARKKRGYGFRCPYCDRINGFESQPTQAFDCEFCSRSVHFEDGSAVPVRTVSCPFCSTEHRVAVNVQRYVCDRCNRPLELKTQGSAGGPTIANIESDTGPQNFDVLLLAADRRHEIEIAMKLQNILVVNLPEARRLMSSASTTEPLVVSANLPQRKAEAIRRQLQDVGATATLRPVDNAFQGAPRV